MWKERSLDRWAGRDQSLSSPHHPIPAKINNTTPAATSVPSAKAKHLRTKSTSSSPMPHSPRIENHQPPATTTGTRHAAKKEIQTKRLPPFPSTNPNPAPRKVSSAEKTSAPIPPTIRKTRLLHSGKIRPSAFTETRTPRKLNSEQTPKLQSKELRKFLGRAGPGSSVMPIAMTDSPPVRPLQIPAAFLITGNRRRSPLHQLKVNQPPLQIHPGDAHLYLLPGIELQVRPLADQRLRRAIEIRMIAGQRILLDQPLDEQAG